MGNVVSISRKGAFSLCEAQNTIAIMRKLTESYAQDVEQKMLHLETINNQNTERILQLEAEINAEIKAWHQKVRKLGGEPKGLWLVDLDSGNGYYCWKYPEAKLDFWHGYNEGFSHRIPIANSPHVMQKETIPSVKNVVSKNS